jgi:TRAP-type mannitol/chloroaromatic compound transport system permease large subunit
LGVELGFGVKTPTESNDMGALGMLIGAVEDCWVMGGRFETAGFEK